MEEKLVGRTSFTFSFSDSSKYLVIFASSSSGPEQASDASIDLDMCSVVITGPHGERGTARRYNMSRTV